MKRSFTRRRFSGARPSRTWLGINGTFALTNITTTTAVEVMSMQAPTTPTNLTADPPEDITILRVVGEFQTAITGSLAANWTLALIVQDTAWTPSALFNTDADKRILWSQSYQSEDNTSTAWRVPGQVVISAGVVQAPREALTLDIAPKVKLETGRALYLVGYESNNGGTLNVVGLTMRLLYQRSRRR